MLRRPSAGDADAIVGLYRRAFGAARSVDADEIARRLDVGPASVLELDGRVAGYGEAFLAGEWLALEVAAPGCWDVLLGWAEDRARAAGIARVRVLDYGSAELAAAAGARGYRPWRSVHRLRIDLDAPPERRRGGELRPFLAEQGEAVRAALNEAFAGDPLHHELSAPAFERDLLGARGFDPTLWLLAWDRDELAGFVLAFPERGGDPAVGVVKVLAVRPGWRRRGLGESLLEAALAELYERGCRTVTLGVDAANSAALRLYERAGMWVERSAVNWELELPSSGEGQGRPA